MSVQSAELIHAYACTGPGLVFRLRLRSPYLALGYRLQRGRERVAAPEGQPTNNGRAYRHSRNGS